nr:MAG TPA: hypothetical protein [Caudoviricetes sp.]
MRMFVINYGSMNTAALQRINGSTYPNYDAAVDAITNCVDCEFPYDDPRHAEAIAEARDEMRDCIYTCDNMAHMAEMLNDIDAEMFVAQHYFVALDWYDTVKSKAAAVRHVVSDHEHLDDDAKLAEWYDKVVDNEICYHSDDELSGIHFVVCDAFDNIALCYALELVHEAICDGKEM